jgi:hypothetical protein
MRITSKLALVSATLLVALGVACAKAKAPAAPTPPPPDTTVGPDGSTLKVNAPAPQSPANGTQIDQSAVDVALVAANVTGANTSIPLFLEFEVRNAAGAVLATQQVPQSSGATTTYRFSGRMDPSAVFTWKVRATYGGAFGPWSPNSTFRAPDIPQAYIRTNEIYDPMTDGKTVGQVVGNVQWLPGQGVRLVTQDTRITYSLPSTLQAGTFSMMVTDVDESNPGDKAKIFSMQENGGDITTNDYRVTAELRGRLYVTPGAVQARIITGDADEHNGRIFDTAREVVDFSRLAWYLWRMTWQTGTFTLEVRRDGPTGQVMYSRTIGTGSSPYRPVPHVLHIGAPLGRAGANDATAAGMIVKNVWVSPTQTRPPFPVP